MADEKKPKIDLKARLGKTAMGQTPPPAGAGGVGVPQPAPAPGTSQNIGGMQMPQAQPGPMAQPAPQSTRGMGQMTPAPGPTVGIPVGPPPIKGPSRPPPGLDPNHPLAQAVQPYRQPAPPPPQIQQPQRIEVDEVAVQQAARSGQRKGFVGGLVAAVIFGVVGYLAGGATEQSSGRKKSSQDAHELSADVGKAKDKLKDMADKLDTGRNMLVRDKKFPDQLGKDLAALNVDFGGDKLAFRRFSGFSQDATSQLTEFIASVQSLNDRKLAVVNLLTKLQKPITEQFKSAGQTTLNQVVLLGRQDDAHNNYAILAQLKDPIAVQPPNINLPAEFTFIDPQTRQPAKLSRYDKGDLTKPAALYVQPKSFDSVCPSETASEAAQLAGQIKHIIDDIRGENVGAPTDQNIVQDSKPGLLERADRLIINLNRVQ